MIKTEPTSIDKLEGLGICVILHLFNKYRSGDLNYIRSYCKEYGMSDTQVFMYLANNVNESILYNDKLRELESINKDLSFPERLQMVLTLCELKY